MPGEGSKGFPLPCAAQDSLAALWPHSLQKMKTKWAHLLYASWVCQAVTRLEQCWPDASSA